MRSRPVRTVPRSFRIDQKALEIIHSEAKRRRISPSALVSQLLVAYVEYGRYVEQMGALTLGRQTLVEILNATEDEALIKAGERAARATVPLFIGAMRGRVTLSSIRDFTEVLSKHAHAFEYSETQDTDGMHWTLVHGLGPKWSLFLAHYFGRAFELAKVQARHEIYDRGVIFWLET